MISPLAKRYWCTIITIHNVSGARARKEQIMKPTRIELATHPLVDIQRYPLDHSVVSSAHGRKEQILKSTRIELATHPLVVIQHHPLGNSVQVSNGWCCVTAKRWVASSIL